MSAMTNPRLLAGPAVWKAADATGDRSWEVELDSSQRAAIVSAARSAASTGASIASIDAASFPLPSMQADIGAWSGALESGRGFLLVHGFPIDELDEHEVELAYVGLGSHLGRPVGQNKQGELLTHVRDERLPEGSGKVRLYRTRERQDFHTDGADIIGLLCLHAAPRGGESKLASSWSLLNGLLDIDPRLVDALRQPLGWDRQGDVPPGESPWFMLAPLSEVGGLPRLFYLGWYIRDSQQHPDAPRLTDLQLEAMATLERLANDPTYHVEMEFRPGDVQFLNNGRILHAREAYDDHEDPAERRHLLRLWLAAHRFASVDEGLRRGVAPAAATGHGRK